jgi:hypothetical protein
MESHRQHRFEAIHEIRDRALMLSLGNEYLCKEVFLKKIGQAIALNVKELANDISLLKRELPERFGGDVQTDRILKGIYNTARRLQEPDEEVHQKCSIGVLGRELEGNINSLARVIKPMGQQVQEGRSAHKEPEVAVPERITLEIEEEKPLPTEPQTPPVVNDDIHIEIVEPEPRRREPEPRRREPEPRRREPEPRRREPEPLPEVPLRLEIEKEPIRRRPEPQQYEYITLPIEEQARVYGKPEPPAPKPIELPAKKKKRVRPKRVRSFSPFGWLSPIGHMVSALFAFSVKLFVTLTLIPVLLLLISILPFTYLALTMETEESLLKGIEQSQAYIQSQQEVLAKLDYQKTQLSKQIESMARKADLSRKDKVEVMDLYVNVHQIDEERSKVQFEVATQEQKIKEKQEKIEDIKGKPFWKRLLRL